MIWILGGVLVVVAVVLGFSYYAYYVAFRRSKKSIQLSFPDNDEGKRVAEILDGLISDLKSKDFEPVEITSYDGLKLFGR